MVKFYIISTVIVWISILTWCLALEIDKKRLGIKDKTDYTAGQAIAIIIQIAVIMSIPLFNILTAIIVWFKYDEALNKAKEKVKPC